MRLFIASSLAPAIQREIGILLHDLKYSLGDNQVKWVNPSGIHLTLKFLGDTSEEIVPEIVRIMDEVSNRFTPFPIMVRGIGCFPSFNQPRVIWVAVIDESGSLINLQEGIERGMKKLGFAREKRAFHPHLTLGRVRRKVWKSEIKLLGQGLSQISSPDLGSQDFNQIALIKSDLRPQGAVYTVLHSSKLGN